MVFRAGAWLWFCVGQGVILSGGGLTCPEKHKEKTCFELHWLTLNFGEARNYCRSQGGHLAYTWNQDVQDLIKESLREQEKWWFGLNSGPPVDHQGKGNPEFTSSRGQHAPHNTPSKLFCKRICQKITLPTIKPKTTQEVVSFTSVLDERSVPVTQKYIEPSSIKPRTTQELVSGTAVLDKQSLPVTPKYIRPSSITQPEKPLSEITTVAKEEPFLRFLTILLQGSFQNNSTKEAIQYFQGSMPEPLLVTNSNLYQSPLSRLPNLRMTQHQISTNRSGNRQASKGGKAMDEAMGNLREAIRHLESFPALQTACEALQKLTDLNLLFSRTAQIIVSDSLLYLSEQLLRVPCQNGRSFDSKFPTASCLFHSFNNIMKAGDRNLPISEQDTKEMEDLLAVSLIVLEKIQSVFLQGCLNSETSVKVTSSLTTMLLSSQNISTLPLSSYTLGDPAPVKLSFPSASALNDLLNKHPGINVQVMGLAFNPFKYLDQRNIVGSIGSVVLTSNYQALQVSNLREDVELMLWRDDNSDTSPTRFNMSTDSFVITVNITSLEESLIVQVEPENPLEITLYLGFLFQPNSTHFILNITLPKDKVWQKDEEYTWVLSPASLQYGMGTYYVTVEIAQPKEFKLQTPMVFSVITAATQCCFWDHYNKTWKSDGCQVGPQSTITRTQCLCDHLTFFGSTFFIVPRMVNVRDTVQLFLGVTSNPVGVSLLASLLGFYVIIVMWAWRRDKEDLQKAKLTILADNDPVAQFCYLIQVFTGYRRRAATTAKVILTLYGTEGRSEPHHLSDPQKTVFERGGLDVFLLTTRSPLGELHSIRLWHDNSGPSPSWYVSQVIVSDVAAKKKWHFLCNSWLAVDIGDCLHDRVFSSASKKQLFSFRHLYSSKIIEGFTQDYLWLSVLTRCPWNPFSRVQRLSCCVTLLLCNMVINIMFWKERNTGNTRVQQDMVGPFAVTWSELFNSVQTTAILFPINLVIGRIFQLVRPKDLTPPSIPIQASPPLGTSSRVAPVTQIVEDLKETVGFLCRKNAHLLEGCEEFTWSSNNITELVKILSSLIYSHIKSQGSCPGQQRGPHPANESPSDCGDLNHYLLRMLERLQSRLRSLDPSQSDSPNNLLPSANLLQKLRERLERQILSAERPPREITSFPILDPKEDKVTLARYLPYWFVYVCWFFVAATGLLSAFFTALYSLQLDRERATSWVVSMMLSILQSIFIIQPVKIISLTLLLSLVLRRVLGNNKEKEQEMKMILALVVRCPSSALPGSRDESDPIYRPPAESSPARPKGRTSREKKLFKFTREVVVQVIFLAMLIFLMHSEKSYNEFYFNQAIRKSFTHQFTKIRLLKHFYKWADRTLLPNLFGNYKGFITEGHALLLGTAIIRQIRLPAFASLPKRASPQTPVPSYYYAQEDREDYGTNWSPLDQNSTIQESIWHYQSEEELGRYPIQGQFAIYSGGGYVVNLGQSSSDARSILKHLKQGHWLDRRTKSLFVEFTVYNANVNLFCVVTLIMESSEVGAFSTSVELDTLHFHSQKGFTQENAAQVIFCLLLLYYIFLQGRRLKQQRKSYFFKKSNILDLSIILISFIVVGLHMKRDFLHKRDMKRYFRDRSRNISFYQTIKVNSALTYVTGFLVLLTIIRLWTLMRLSARLYVITRTLKRAWDEVLGFLLIITILLAGYSITFNLLFGWSISDYRTIFDSTVAIIGLLMGIFNYNEVIDLDPVLGSFLIITIVVLMVLVVINLFISAILLIFRTERQLIGALKEAGLMEVLLQKLSSLLGIRRQLKIQTPARNETKVFNEDESAQEKA
ncbi:polycystic kidney disease protein 1-like 3 [Ornithorhynchus anatinus]|uniref:polycystic kidney disease protein 1-like 3 n=1 Tax=Ornithorhynchus anatinus TaxID=9258 RepID=UPI0019D4B687|nr:polycystic kidney disease protein 1-like 3 [Ornithorhynchus anatinus]